MKQFKTINQNKADIEIGYKEQKQHLIDIMKSDEALGLYEESTKCYCGHTTYCDCGPEKYTELLNDNIEEFDNAIEKFKKK